MVYKYAFNKEFDKDTMSRAHLTNQKVSFKKSVEVAKQMQGKKISYVKKYLQEVIELKKPINYKRFNQELAHRKGKGISSGGFPIKVCEVFLSIIKIAESGAKEKSLNETDLYILSVSARKGEARHHYGRYHSRKMKSTNLEIILGVKKK